jgi:hypothetical protein
MSRPDAHGNRAELNAVEESSGELAARVSELEATVERQREQIQTLFEKLHAIEHGDGRGDVASSLVVLEKYAEMEPREREECLGSSDRRAVVLFEHWWDIAKQAGNGNYVVTTHRNSTKKHNPAQVKIDLEQAAGEDLRWEQVYRSMRHIAKLSAASPQDDVESVTDGYGRKHITGGAFEYHEKATPDGSDTYKLVELTDQNSLTLL